MWRWKTQGKIAFEEHFLDLYRPKEQRAGRGVVRSKESTSRLVKKLRERRAAKRSTREERGT